MLGCLFQETKQNAFYFTFCTNGLKPFLYSAYNLEQLSTVLFIVFIVSWLNRIKGNDSTISDCANFKKCHLKIPSRYVLVYKYLLA